MKPIARSSAMLLCALLAAAALPAQARQAQVQSPQQAQQAQQARQQAESFLRKEEAAETGRQNRSTDRANQDAAVADEAAGHSDAARPARSTDPNAGGSATRPAGSAPPPSYGPVLNPRQPQTRDPARKDPAEVHDETDSQTRPSSQQSPQNQQSRQKQSKRNQRRREAWQPAGPLAPRPLNGNEAAAIGYGAVPVPPPAQAPQPVVPTTAPLNSCVGGVCRDAAGATYNLGTTGSGVNSAGRPCTRNGATVSCL